ncbi:MAG: hypothetical protein IPJ74_07930 [Saprospiraceae bacterium]|nr:hypothetical protein [Saprospiraceae bacterium]
MKLAEYNKEIEPSGNYDFYYIFDSDYPALQEQYDIVEKFDGGSRLLLKRKN